MPLCFPAPKRGNSAQALPDRRAKRGSPGSSFHVRLLPAIRMPLPLYAQSSNSSRVPRAGCAELQFAGSAAPRSPSGKQLCRETAALLLAQWAKCSCTPCTGSQGAHVYFERCWGVVRRVTAAYTSTERPAIHIPKHQRERVGCGRTALAWRAATDRFPNRERRRGLLRDVTVSALAACGPGCTSVETSNLLSLAAARPFLIWRRQLAKGRSEQRSFPESLITGWALRD
jgi:hypothetical protein